MQMTQLFSNIMKREQLCDARTVNGHDNLFNDDITKLTVISKILKRVVQNGDHLVRKSMY